ncbi:tetratricopeptide repeat protein [Pseudorhodoplanes sp.]|uniref:tetratricopeptide repeat protein n=1 Tax=Pseudorhodoplanes sp. TaxID=1934341 RepID=UPI003D0E54AC
MTRTFSLRMKLAASLCFAAALAVGPAAGQVPRERQRGPDHTDVASALNYLAVLNQQVGRPKEAARFYRRALSIRQKALGPDADDRG